MRPFWVQINDCALAKYYVESSKLVKGFNDYHEVTENTEIDFASAD